MTNQQQLDILQTRILTILASADSVSIAGRSVKNHSLDMLYKREQYLQKLIARENSGSENTISTQSFDA